MVADATSSMDWTVHAWRRWMRPWRWFALGAGALGLGSVVLEDQSDRLPLVLVLVAALVAWYVVWSRMLRTADAARLRALIPLLAVMAVALSMALTHLSLAFWLFGLTLLALFFVVLPLPWSMLAVVLLTAQAGWESRYGGTQTTLSAIELLAFLLSRAILAAFIGYVLRRMVLLADGRERLALALADAQSALERSAHATGVTEERQRITRELHDTLTQGLSAVVMHLETAEQVLPDAIDESRLHLQRASAIVRESLDDTRRVMASLRPELLEHVELPEAIARYAIVASERVGIPVTTRVTGTPVPLHPEAEITIFRVMQEGLANVRKHAHAYAAAVTLSYTDTVVMLDVQDDGVGFDPSETRKAGSMGLVGMRERVELLHGSLNLESEPGEGTTLSITVPLLLTSEYPAMQAGPR